VVGVGVFFYGISRDVCPRCTPGGLACTTVGCSIDRVAMIGGRVNLTFLLLPAVIYL
jgi:hypothetical protein